MRATILDRGRLLGRFALLVAAVGAVIGAGLVVSGDVAGGRPFSMAATFRALGALASRMFLEGTPPARATVADIAVRAVQTLGVSIAAAGLAAIAAAVSLPVATDRGRTWPRRLASALVRWLYVVTRSVPELVWALVVVFVVRPGALAAALALAIHNAGVIGRLGTDVIEDIDPAAEQAVGASGAGRPLAVLTAVVPQALPQILTFVLYRWEVIIRTTVVVGFVAGSGLGSQFRLAVSFFRWRELGLIISAYVLLVLLVDLSSAGLRRLAR